MKMEKPTVEAVRFGSRDVIATSGQLGVMLGGFGDGEKNNWFASNVQGATRGTQAYDTVSNYLKAASGRKDGNDNFNNGSVTELLSVIVSYEMNDDTDANYANFNGWYIWYNDDNGGYFGKQ